MALGRQPTTFGPRAHTPQITASEQNWSEFNNVGDCSSPILIRTVEQFRIVPEESVVAIYARSNVGPIRWEGTNLRGSFKAEVQNSSLDLTVQPVGRLEFALEHLTSGNPLYDAELMRRLDARQFPITVAELSFLDSLSHHNRYQVQGSLTLHGVTRAITGALALQIEDDVTVQAFCEKVVDIRDFNIPSPSMLMLKIYPDVRVRLKLVAQRES